MLFEEENDGEDKRIIKKTFCCIGSFGSGSCGIADAV